MFLAKLGDNLGLTDDLDLDQILSEYFVQTLSGLLESI